MNETNGVKTDFKRIKKLLTVWYFTLILTCLMKLMMTWRYLTPWEVLMDEESTRRSLKSLQKFLLRCKCVRQVWLTWVMLLIINRWNQVCHQTEECSWTTTCFISCSPETHLITGDRTYRTGLGDLVSFNWSILELISYHINQFPNGGPQTGIRLTGNEPNTWRLNRHVWFSLDKNQTL